MSSARPHVGVLATHPIQYYAPWYRELTKGVDLEVLFSHRQSADGQGRAGYGVAFEWDIPVLDGYSSTFLRNVAQHPDVNAFWGCNTPEVSDRIRRGRFDAFIVHGWATWSYWQAMIACWQTGTPLLVRGDSNLTTPRPAWWRAAKEPAFRAFIPRFDAYLVVGAKAREYFVHYGADPARCFDAPHAVDNRRFASVSDAVRADRGSARRQLGLPEDGTVFLFVGRFVEGKDPRSFIRAIASAASHVPGVYGLLAGDGPLRAEIEQLAATLNAPVRFAGFRNQKAMPGVYASSDVLVVPSHHETWGLIVNEAMACGLPVLASRGVGCVGDLVVAGDTGDVFDIGATDQLSTLMEQMARDAGLRREMGGRARARVAAFDVSVAAAGTVRAIREVMRARESRDAREQSVEARGLHQ